MIKQIMSRNKQKSDLITKEKDKFDGYSFQCICVSLCFPQTIFVAETGASKLGTLKTICARRIKKTFLSDTRARARFG